MVTKWRDLMAAAPAGISVMRQTMDRQAQALAGILDDDAPVMAVAERLRGRRVLAIGTGTSWHAASQAAALLRAAGIDASAAQSADAAIDGPVPGEDGALLAFSHTGAKRYTAQAAQRARSQGADLPGLGEIPSVADRAHRAQYEDGQLAPAPARLMEFIGGGINQWTAAEGALKIREAAYVASEGLGVEQFLHGPSVAVGRPDRLVALDGGGTWSARIAEVAQAAEASGVPVTRIVHDGLGELLSIFPLTVAVQRIALEAAETLGVNPDTFGLDLPERQAWERIE